MKTASPAERPRHELLGLAGWLALCFAASATGIFIGPGEWYQNLEKPSWNPPSAVFGPVWTVLYALMGVAAWLVWREGGWKAQSKVLTLFLVQWVLNAAWTPIFFGLHRPGWAFVEVVALWVVAVMTGIGFWKVRRLAGILWIPYVLWLSFAAVLNFTIWRLQQG